MVLQTLVNIIVSLHSLATITAEEGGLQVVAAITPGALVTNTKTCSLEEISRVEM